MPRSAAAIKPPKLIPATIRDFGGGWNVADNEYNLSSKYMPISDNVQVGVDNSLSPRPGYEFSAELKAGTETTFAAQAYSVVTTNASSRVKITWTTHPFVDNDHITFTTSISHASLPSPLFGTYGIRKIDANNFDIIVRTPATASTTEAKNSTVIRDTHKMGGSWLEQAFFQDHVVVFSTIGEVIGIDTATLTPVLIWSNAIAWSRAGNPNGWRMIAGETALRHVSFDTYKQTLLCVNGRLNDKPLEINFTRANIVEFLVDPASGANTFVYSADFIQSFGGYVLLYASNNPAAGVNLTPTLVDISAVNTSGVFVGNPAPDDAVQIDLGRVTSTIEPRITGCGNIRNNVVVTFYDSGMLGRLGIYTAGGKHDPDFDDQVPQHGSLNHRVLINVGNDIFMTDSAGVPAYSQSLQSGSIVPARTSQLIDPALNTHFGRLSSDTLQYNVWSIFNLRDRQYMIWVPKFDSASAFNGAPVPFYTTADLYTQQAVVVNAPKHTVTQGDFVVVSGAVGYTGIIAGDLNGTREVLAVIDEDYFLMKVGSVPTVTGQSGGGASVVFTPVNDETICYAFTYNTEMRIRRWTRYRDLQFTAGCVAKDGKIYFGRGSRLYRFGTNNKPIYADAVSEYDDLAWTNNHAYTVGRRVKDGNFIYICLIAHTSAVAGTFADDRILHPDYWELYVGYAIAMTMETAWSDFKDRSNIKDNKTIGFDTQGNGRFLVETYVDNIYLNKATLAMAPAASMEFIAQSSGGYGAGTQNFGGGRRAKEQFTYSYPFRCMLGKIRITAATKTALKIVSITLRYLKGGPNR